MVVSYPGKRSIHISKGSFSGNATVIKRPHHINQNQEIRNSFGTQNKTNEYLNPQFSGSNHHHHHQLIQPDQSNGQKSFWTCCPFCRIKYQYRRSIVNRIVCCQNCLRTFMAYDSGAQGALQRSNCGKTGNQGVTCDSSLDQPGSCQQKQAIKQEAIKLCAKITGGFQSSLPGSKVNNSTKVTPEPVIRPAVASVVGGSLKTKGKNDWPTTTEPASDEGKKFWTCCPFCNIKSQYLKDIMNRVLRCQNCLKPFIANDSGAQDEQLRSNQGKSGGQGVASSSISQWKVGAQSTGMVPCPFRDQVE